jgi:integration host factor subunit alpha
VATLNRAGLAERLSARLGLSRRESAELVDALIEEMARAFEAGDEVKVPAFGSFHVREKAARMGRNPATGGPLLLDGRRVLTFKPSALLRARLNADQELG